MRRGAAPRAGVAAVGLWATRTTRVCTRRCLACTAAAVWRGLGRGASGRASPPPPVVVGTVNPTGTGEPCRQPLQRRARTDVNISKKNTDSMYSTVRYRDRVCWGATTFYIRGSIDLPLPRPSLSVRPLQAPKAVACKGDARGALSDRPRTRDTVEATEPASAATPGAPVRLAADPAPPPEGNAPSAPVAGAAKYQTSFAKRGVKKPYHK